MFIRMAALLLLVSLAPDLGAADKPKSVIDQLRPGMTPVEVRALFGGAPSRIARQFLYRRHLEIWTYELPTPVFIEISCMRGEEPRVLRVHQGDSK